MHLPAWQHWLSITALAAVGMFVITLILGLPGLVGIKSTIPKYATVGLLIVSIAVLGLVALGASLQEEATSQTRDDVRQIKDALGVTSKTEATGSQLAEAIKSLAVSVASLEEEKTGKQAYCYFRLAIRPRPGIVPAGYYQLALDATDSVFSINYWISLASANRDPQNEGYWAVDVRKPLIPVAYKGPHAWERVLPPGDYYIEFDAVNGHWVEHLTLYLENAEIRQRIDVTRDGQTIFKEG
jgi:hypothetical protein